MIEQTENIPDSMIYLTVKHHIFFALYHGGDIYGHIAIRPVGDECQIHMQFAKFCISSYRQLKNHDWPLMRQFIRGLGCKWIFAVYENHTDKKMNKFLKIMGFELKKIVAISSMEA